MAISAAMNPLNPPMACGTPVAKLPHEPVAEAKHKRRHDENQNSLEHGEDELKVAGLLDAQIVQPGDEPCHGDGEHLRPQQRNRPGTCAPSQWNAGKTPSVRARPLVTAAIEAGLATANHVHM